MAASTPAKKANTAARSATAKANSAAERQKAERKQMEAVQEFMASPLDFTPITLDVGDGVQWDFTPDPQPSQTERLSAAMRELDKAQAGKASLVEVFEELKEAIRDRLMHEEDREKFPLPLYGVNALSWFALRVATGRDGFPTESDSDSGETSETSPSNA